MPTESVFGWEAIISLDEDTLAGLNHTDSDFQEFVAIMDEVSKSVGSFTALHNGDFVEATTSVPKDTFGELCQDIKRFAHKYEDLRSRILHPNEELGNQTISADHLDVLVFRDGYLVGSFRLIDFLLYDDCLVMEENLIHDVGS